MMRRIAVLDAPSNLGLRPPTLTSVPGCGKAPGALRDQGLLPRLRARDAGCLTSPRYDAGDWRPGDGVCHAREIADYSAALADRVGAIIDRGEFPLVLGGDCSILLGSALAMHRLGEEVGGRIGLIYVDGHSDFRHPGNASYVGAAAGESLALVTGRGQADLAAIEGRRPYFRDIDVVVLGIRAQDEYRLDLQAAGIVTRPVPALRAEGAARTAQWAHEQLADCAGYWVHVDVDVLDPAVMPAVDAPDAGGIAFAELEILLAGLVDTPHCLGVELTVFDPDYDRDGAYAAEIVNTVVAGLRPVTAPAPPLTRPGIGRTDRTAPAPRRTTERTPGRADRADLSAVPDQAARGDLSTRPDQAARGDLVEHADPNDRADPDDRGDLVALGDLDGRAHLADGADLADGGDLGDRAEQAVRAAGTVAVPDPRDTDFSAGPGSLRRPAAEEGSAGPGSLRRSAVDDQAGPGADGLRPVAAEPTDDPRGAGGLRLVPADSIGDLRAAGGLRPVVAEPPAALASPTDSDAPADGPA
ncbi:arginase family protein [Verrucosispora sp. FIM060022]|nr:arginase family protein [Verrucosispora sp. FIM060022]